MVLCHDIVQVLDLTYFHDRAMLLIVAFDGRFMRATAVNGDRLGDAIAAEGFFSKAEAPPPYPGAL